MAAASSSSETKANTTNKQIFVDQNGHPMEFYLRGVSDMELPEVSMLIERHGGLITPWYKFRAINLVSQSQAHHYRSGRFYLPQWVVKSVAVGEILPLNDYRTEVSTVASSSSSSKKRLQYRDYDDLTIIKYVEKSNLTPGGVKLWQELEALGVLPHSWQSMRDRYRKILANTGKAALKRLHEKVQRMQQRSLALYEKQYPQSDAEKRPASQDESVADASGPPKQKRKLDPPADPESSPTHVDSEAIELLQAPPATFEGTANDEEEVKEVWNFLMQQTGLSKQVVIHALIVQSGDVHNALQYLQLGKRGRQDEWIPMDIRPWAFEEDSQLTQGNCTELPGRTREEILMREQYLAS